MKIGRSIRQIREEHQMSQEKFGEIFFVTRQTVSNWENEKSYPDLNTLVKISDEFDVSLDKLLKEDPEMVNKISERTSSGIKWNKLRRTLIIIAAALFTTAAILSASYYIVWRSRKTKLEGAFNDAIAALGFTESEQRYYTLTGPDGITYRLPHQEMPPMWELPKDFHAKHLSGSFNIGSGSGEVTVLISDIDTYTMFLTEKLGEDETFIVTLDTNGEITGGDTLPDTAMEQYTQNLSRIRETISHGSFMYQKVYP